MGGVLTVANGGDIFGYFNLGPPGAVHVNGGNFVLSGGGQIQGVMDAADIAATIALVGGEFVLSGNAAFVGPGLGRALGTGPVMTLTKDTEFENFELGSGATLQGQGTFICTNTLRWSGGIMKGPGETRITPNHDLIISGGGILDNRVLQAYREVLP